MRDRHRRSTRQPHPFKERLPRLRTVRESDEEVIASLHYHYDPVGNITDIRDTAQQTVYFQNSVVTADNSYTYDAVYRLTEATGREHSTVGTSQRTHVQPAVQPQPMTTDPSAMRTYTQSYVYDEVGNILEMVHTPGTGSGWTRYYAYDEDGNRLLATSTPTDDPEGPYSDEYDYDTHGNMVTMPHLSSIVWNHDDEMQEVTAGSETVYFQYAGGQRVRKFVEKTGSATEERIYLGPWEIYRKRISGVLEDELETLHVSDDTGRILMVETKTVEEGDAVGSPEGIWRFQLSNHLGTAVVEIAEDGEVISYEEYYPYGCTSYRAMDSGVEVSAKRYRYTGMERDEETGLALHGARYYACWLGRWTATDPIGLGDGVNRYGYVQANPVGLKDLGGMGAEDWNASPDPLGTTDPWITTEFYTGRLSGLSQALTDHVNAVATRTKPEPTPSSETPNPTRAPNSSAEPFPLGLPPVEEAYPEVRGTFSLAYDEAVQGYSDPSNPTWARAAFFGLAVLEAPVAVVDKAGEAILNAPRSADLSGQLAGQAVLSQNPTVALERSGEAFQHFTAAFTGLGTPAALRVPSVKPTTAAKAEGVTVFRVEGTPNTRVLIGEGGEVAVTGQQTLFLNFGNRARAEAFLAKRLSQGMPGAEVKSFEVQQSFLDDLRAAAVPESKARLFPDRPIVADPTKAPDQFGLRREQIEGLQNAVRQGSGKRGF